MKIRGDCVTQIFELDGARGLKWLFEIHDILVEAHHCRLFLDHISESALGALWDMGHTRRLGRE